MRSSEVDIRFCRKKTCDYLNIACGPSIFEDFYNHDYTWRAGIDACWDISKGLPLPSNEFRGCFTEHCLEHVSLPVFRQEAAEIGRVLKPGGCLRIVVPDAEIYLRGYLVELNGDYSELPYRDPTVEKTALMSVNRIFRDHGHQYAQDYETIRVHLSELGFVDVQRKKYREGRDPHLLVDAEGRKLESLYVEAVKSMQA